jgi:hypothetical protein
MAVRLGFGAVDVLEALLTPALLRVTPRRLPVAAVPIVEALDADGQRQAAIGMRA